MCSESKNAKVDKGLDEERTRNNNEKESRIFKNQGRRSKGLLYKRVGIKKAKQVDRMSRIRENWVN